MLDITHYMFCQVTLAMTHARTVSQPLITSYSSECVIQGITPAYKGSHYQPALSCDRRHVIHSGTRPLNEQ